MTAGIETASRDSLAARLSALIQTRHLLVESAAVGLSVVILLISVLPNLANHPTITDDEMWVFSSAYKLATEGVFGTDMFAGFFNADRHYYFNMPAHHVAIAAAFKLLGTGIVQARLVGVAYGVATLVLSYVLARRLYGIATAILSLLLLLFLRLNMGFDTGLPLQELSVNMRYDLAPIPFLLGGLLILYGGPSTTRCVIAGLLFGVGMLMQFYGAFIFPIAMAFIWLERPRARERVKLAGALLGAAALVGLPYGAYILDDYTDFKGQAGTIDRRADFDKPGFYIDNLGGEPGRFLRPLAFKEVPKGADHEKVPVRWLSLMETLQRRPSAKLAVLIGLPFALAFSGWGWLREGRRADRLLFLCLAGLILEYTFFESAKFYIYWLPVVPFLCIGIAAAAVWLLQPQRRSALRLVAAGATALALLVVFAEGGYARLSGIRTAPDATDYQRLADVIHQTVPPGSRVVGSTSLWWGMRDTDYRSYFLFFYLTRPDAGPYKMKISEFLGDFDPDYVVLTRLATGELEKHLIPPDYEDWQAYMRQHTGYWTRIEGPVVIKAYGFIDIWRLDR